MKKSTPKTPADLSAEAAAWLARIVAEYDISDAAGVLLVQTAMQAFDRMRQAQELIVRYGAVTEDRFQQLRPNPACTIERDSRAAMMAALKALNLDLEPLKDGPGRPAGR